MSEASERARKYRALLFKQGETDIAFTLNDDALYDLMYSLNWLGEFYRQDYREAQKDPQKMEEVNERFTQRAEQLLKKSGYNKKEIEEKLEEFKNTIMSFCGIYSRSSKIFSEYFDKNTPWDDYYAELDTEILAKKDELPKFISKGIKPPKAKTQEETISIETTEELSSTTMENDSQSETIIEETSIADSATTSEGKTPEQNNQSLISNALEASNGTVRFGKIQEVANRIITHLKDLFKSKSERNDGQDR